jgi:hypothetical protein
VITIAKCTSIPVNLHSLCRIWCSFLFFMIQLIIGMQVTDHGPFIMSKYDGSDYQYPEGAQWGGRYTTHLRKKRFFHYCCFCMRYCFRPVFCSLCILYCVSNKYTMYFNFLNENQIRSCPKIVKAVYMHCIMIG